MGERVRPRHTSSTRFIAASFRSLYRPLQPCEMRPSRVTPVASMIISPAPEQARLPRCTVCQSLKAPSAALYWHMGDTTMRLGRVIPPNWMGVKSLAVIRSSLLSGIWESWARRRRSGNRA